MQLPLLSSVIYANIEVMEFRHERDESKGVQSIFVSGPRQQLGYTGVSIMYVHVRWPVYSV